MRTQDQQMNGRAVNFFAASPASISNCQRATCSSNRTPAIFPFRGYCRRSKVWTASSGPPRVRRSGTSSASAARNGFAAWRPMSRLASSLRYPIAALAQAVIGGLGRPEKTAEFPEESARPPSIFRPPTFFTASSFLVRPFIFNSCCPNHLPQQSKRLATSISDSRLPIIDSSLLTSAFRLPTSAAFLFPSAPYVIAVPLCKHFFLRSKASQETHLRDRCSPWARSVTKRSLPHFSAPLFSRVGESSARRASMHAARA